MPLIVQLYCPHCASRDVSRWGRQASNESQRYRCRGCRKTFNEWTGTPISRVRKKTAWPAFAQSMKLGLPTKDAASISAVSKKTVFRWRHKVLESLDGLILPVLTGIVEADETFFRRSYKGQKVVGRRPRKRGGHGSRRGTGKDKVAVLVACDRSGNVRMETVDRSNAASITLAVQNLVDPDATLCTDAAGPFSAATATLGMDHVVVPGKARTKGIYHIQTVNVAHSQLKGFLSAFRGVSTQHLPRYLEWFRSRNSIQIVAPALPAGGKCPVCGR